jgi:hypothetical protein
MLITLFLDYQGGTYVSQLEVRDLGELASRLADAIDWNAVRPPVSRTKVTEFAGSIGEAAPCPLGGLQQVWCMTGMLGEKLAIVHAVHTAKDGGDQMVAG